MKKFSVFAFAAMIMFVLPTFAACDSGGSSSQGAKDPSNSVQGAPSGIRVAAIDVGKGDCILVQAGSSSALIDTGYADTSDEVVSYLRQQGVSSLDCLVITHFDKDHVGGLRAIGKAFNIGTIYLPGYQGADKHYHTTMTAVDELGLPAQRVTKKQALKLGDASLSILPTSLTYIPDANGDEGNDNDLSLVVTLAFQKDSFLFAGDLEEEGIDAYLASANGHYDVLKMPHHGRKSSSTDELIDSVQPEIALITDDIDDPASKKTLKLLDAADVNTYCTSTCGTIVVTSDGLQNYEVSTDYE